MADVSDLRLPLRRAIVEYFRAPGPVFDELGSEFYGERAPAGHGWPFGHVGWSDLAGFAAQGIIGGEVDVTIHTYAKGASTDVLAPIDKAIIEQLDQATLVLDEGYLMNISFVRARTLPDGTDGFHGVLSFTAITGIDDT